ncbi:gas vesicle protein GvpG [Saccharomonospora sp. NPDC006951]
MGLLGEILLLPLAPVRGVLWTFDTVLTEAERQRAGEIHRELAELENALLAGELGEDEFDRLEDALLDELTELNRGEPVSDSPQWQGERR